MTLEDHTVDSAVGSPRPTFGARRRIAMLLWAAYGIAAWAVVLGAVELFAPGTPPVRIFIDTLWWSLAAFVATSLLIDRSIHAPVAEGGLWVVFSSAAAFVTVLILFAATHSPYSRVALFSAFWAQSIWLLLGVQLHMRFQVLRLGIPEPSVMTMLEASRDALTSVQLTHVQAELVASQRLEELQALDGVVIDRYTRKGDALVRLITQLKLRGTRIYSTEHIHELLTGRVALHHTEDSFLDDSSGRVLYTIIKRMLDLASAAILLVLLCIPMAMIALAIRLIDHQSPMFRQPRVGKNGSVFLMRKFRTMRSDGDDATQTGADTHESARITPLGHVLRRYRLDELPQLFNILEGTMSLIGPRPEWTATAAAFFEAIPHYPYRHLVRPGITGWAQVNQGHVTALPDAMIKLELDLYYVKHMSFALDLVVGARTFRTILTGHGAR
jgi:lipopolysaccharide/colanic/teichoic acid biosynthesis glycosyltransferase